VIVTKVLFGWVICLLLCALCGFPRDQALLMLGASTLTTLVISVRVTIHKD
jgi:hypothetical protein